MRGYLSALILAFATAVVPATATAQNDGIKAKFRSPDILVLGDSQIPFGTGASFHHFFENLTENCGFKSRLSRRLGNSKVAVIGVRSTSLGTWTKRSKSGKRAICSVDPKWRVNAGSFGVVNTSKNIYVQIGQGKNYQFCAPQKSAFETMFRPDYYNPKLVFLTFLGNSSATWARSAAAARKDVQAAIDQLPPHIPCIFMTSAPPYKQSIIRQRTKAQENLRAAFMDTGGRCAFVDGFTPDTIKANLGVAKHFRRHKSGKVKDPFHPNARAAKVFFRLQHSAICNAVAKQLTQEVPPRAAN